MPSVLGMAKSSAYWVSGLLVSALIAITGLTLASQDSRAATPIATQGPPQTTAPATPAASSEPSTSALEAIDTDADFAVAAVDVDTGETLTYGKGSFDTASIVKVDILAALLHRRSRKGVRSPHPSRAWQGDDRAQRQHRSDNALQRSWWQGGSRGVQRDDRAEPTTVVGSNGYWGLTQTTAADQLKLLEVVFGDDSVLSADSRAYMKELMSNVIDAQNFGVSAAADDADDAALKVGYLQRSATGLWDVTSIGEIEAGGHTYLVAVLSDGNANFDSGVVLVDQVAEAAVDGLS